MRNLINQKPGNNHFWTAICIGIAFAVIIVACGFCIGIALVHFSIY